MECLFSDDNITLESFKKSLIGCYESKLKHYLLEDAIVIGFEINTIDIHYMNTKNIPWINVCISPIRFLDDLGLNITSSFDYNWSKYSVSDNVISLFANIQKSKYPQHNYEHQVPPKRNTIEKKNRSILILGQSINDKSVFFDGEFKSLLDYIDIIESIVGDYDTVYYRRHPYETDDKVDAKIKELFNAQDISNVSIYDAFSWSDISTVTAISSSSLHEAKYFGHNVIFLEPRAAKYKFDTISISNLYKAMVDIPFLQVNQMNCIDVVVPINTLRKMFGSWSYITESEMLEIRINSVRQELEQLNEKLAGVENWAADLNNSLLSVYQSASWKLTKPLRSSKKIIKRLSQLFRLSNVSKYFKNVQSEGSVKKKLEKKSFESIYSVVEYVNKAKNVKVKLDLQNTRNFEINRVTSNRWSYFKLLEQRLLKYSFVRKHYKYIAKLKVKIKQSKLLSKLILGR
ncbi:hypothetical protein F7310_02825 [Francisella uliginis]|uniref:Uncharacterized protein n=2 Tax=Francisella uliginis TaxID=573570 RepID=A0A1L4BR94_9GAMM|nr:hypothetical protein F7310_02825 [Francisella uliginis]